MLRFLHNLISPRQDLDKIYLFVHLPKCGGTSVLKMCSQLGTKRCVVVAETQTKKEALDLLQSKITEQNIVASQLDLIMGRNVYHGMHKCSPREPFYFTLLRDPIERYISQYSFHLKCVADPCHKGHQMSKERVLENGKVLSIKQFAERNQSRNILTRTLAAASSNAEAPQNSWWQVSPKVAPGQAEWMLNQMSFIGFLDQFDQDIQLICEKLKIEPQLQHVNESSSAEVEIDQETMELIRENNRLDFATYELAKKISKTLRTKSQPIP